MGLMLVVWSRALDLAGQIWRLLVFTVFSTVLWWSEVEVEWGVDTRISLNKPVLLPDRVDLADFGGGVGGSSSLALPSPARHGDAAKKGTGDG